MNVTCDDDMIYGLAFMLLIVTCLSNLKTSHDV